MDEEDLYKALGVTPGASSAEIQQAYRKLAREYHPDKVSHLGHELQEVAEKKMRLINRAYSVLSNALTRKEYDQKRLGSQAVAPPRGPTASGSSAGYQPPAAAAPSSADARDVMLIETQLYQIKEKIRKETRLVWTDFKESGFTSAIRAVKAGLGKKEYLFYFLVNMMIEPSEFRDFIHRIRALDARKNAPGMLGARITVFVIAFRNQESPKKIDDMFNIFNSEAEKSGKTKRYIVFLNVTNNRVTLPQSAPKDRLLKKIFGIFSKIRHS
ncbi:MAG: J domain-containing protein [Planctomycetota bacterium]|nr:MAG: J domain-containing protein [Planctomycetota bacterium]